MGYCTCPNIHPGVLVHLEAVIRIVTTVIGLSFAKQPPIFFLRAVTILGEATAVLLPCLTVLYVPFLLRWFTRCEPHRVGRYVDESICTDDFAGDERLKIELDELEVSSDDTITCDSTQVEKTIDEIENYDSDDSDGVPDLIGQGDEVTGIEKFETNLVLPGDETGDDFNQTQGHYESNDLLPCETPTRDVGVNTMNENIHDERLEKLDKASCGCIPDYVGKSTEGVASLTSPQFEDPAHKSSLTKPRPYAALPEKRQNTYLNPAFVDEKHISRKTRMFESAHVTFETRTRPPWAMG
ncbi:hypothetical protein BDV25DRAFT_140204 [Aspergillus avenaceus]|uniref:Uncharacterized protein n=1 Tax=Aspergillus avenaceus TaxID=36643 RepID=A0A5N6TVI5_ASPAV|nr:hypothetical protein BDV25DRAFT_140204 [Aspergillus avenaceus]